MAPRARNTIAAASTIKDKCHSAIELPNGWNLGSKLGEGAQGSVYAIVNGGKDTEWAVKVTPKPTHAKSKAQAEARANSYSLNNEGQLYKVHLKPLRGTIVPRTPEDFQGVQESNGYLYLIMERMDCELFGKLEEMVRSTKSSFIAIGPLAQKMVSLVKAIHEVHLLTIDVKPENFMFTTAETACKSLESRIRLVDFGLMRMFARPEMRADLQGNAMYASLFMHTLHNSSRRDDLEMICYVLGEMVIRLHAMVTDTAAAYERTSIPSYLPWSQESSDQELGELKRLNVENPQSEFYKRMPVPAATTLFECLQLIWAYKFNSTPDYDTIAEKLGTLTVPCGSKNTGGKTKLEPSKRSSRGAVGQENTRVNASVMEPESGDISACLTAAKGSDALRTQRLASRTVATQTDDADVLTTFKRQASTALNEQGTRRKKRDKAHASPTAMEVDVISVDSFEDNNDSLQDSEMNDVEVNSTNSIEPDKLGIKMVIQTSGQPDLSYIVVENETVFLGRKPSKQGGTLIRIPGSKEDNHIKLTLAIKRQRVVHAVVRDLNTKQGTDVGREGVCRRLPIKKGGESVCMIPGQIYVGDSVIQLQRM